jgi:hypothetical protein
MPRPPRPGAIRQRAPPWGFADAARRHVRTDGRAAAPGGRQVCRREFHVKQGSATSKGTDSPPGRCAWGREAAEDALRPQLDLRHAVRRFPDAEALSSPRGHTREPWLGRQAHRCPIGDALQWRQSRMAARAVSRETRMRKVSCRTHSTLSGSAAPIGPEGRPVRHECRGSLAGFHSGGRRLCGDPVGRS